MRRQQRREEPAEHQEEDDHERNGRGPATIGRASTQWNIGGGLDGPGAVRHWISRSARARSPCGKASPSTLAVLTLMTSSNVVGRSTGNSPGFAPLKMRSTYAATPRYITGKFGP